MTYGGFAPLRHRGPHAPGWLSERVAVGRRLGAAETTAQVHPARFTAAMMRAAEAQGAELRIGRVTGLDTAAGLVTGVIADGETLSLGNDDAVVIAMGPWSILAAGWLRLPAVFGLKGHSLVFDTGPAIPAEAAFLEYRESSGEVLGPELFPRPDGTTYVCGISSESALPLDPAEVTPDPGAIERLHAICADVSPVLASAKVLAAQACFRPIARDGLPLIGRVPGPAERLCRDRAQRLGHSERAGHRRGDGRADRRGPGTLGRSLTVSTRPACRRSTRRACAAPASCNRRSAYPGFIGGNTSSGSRPSS